MSDDRRQDVDGLEMRLQSAYRGASLPEPPETLRAALDRLPDAVVIERDRRRRRVVGLLPALAAILLLGGLAVAGSAGWLTAKPLISQQAAVSSASSEPSAAAGIGLVPWSSETPGPPAPSASATEIPTAPACEPGQLGIGHAGWQGATGSLAGGFAIWNTGATPCILDGVPGIEILDGHSRPLQVIAGGAPDEPRQPVLLAPGQVEPNDDADLPVGTASAFIWWSNWCGDPPDGPVRLRVALPDGRALGTVPFARPFLPRCDAPSSGSVLSIGPFEAVPGPDPTEPPALPAETLHLALELPARATIGEPLHYVAVLSNETASAVSLAPCPVYMERLNTRGQPIVARFVLNCEPSRVIEPGQALRFEMVMELPPSLQPTNDAALVWALDPYGSQGFAPRSPEAKLPIALVAP